MQIKSTFLALVVIFGGVLFFTNQAQAQSNRALNQANQRATDRMMAKDEIKTQNQAGQTERVQAQQRACLARESAITNRMSRLVALANNMSNNFEQHSLRVQNYYLDTLVPAGLTLNNYSDLLADIAAEEAVVQTTIANAQADVDEFSCEAGDIRAHYQTFRTDMQMVKSALADYRTSIRNLIVAVSQLAEDLPEEPEASATPVASPSPTI